MSDIVEQGVAQPQTASRSPATKPSDAQSATPLSKKDARCRKRGFSVNRRPLKFSRTNIDLEFDE